jgi:hypothetical protein
LQGGAYIIANREGNMSRKDERVDAYIARSAEFARPILSHIRRVVHGACPDVEETIKWGFPHFTHHGIVCGMAGFKGHCALFFWKRALIFKSQNSGGSTGHFRQIKSVKDLPGEKTLAGYVRKAAALNEAGVRAPAEAKSKVKKAIVVPKVMKAACSVETFFERV